MIVDWTDAWFKSSMVVVRMRSAGVRVEEGRIALQ